MGRRRGFRRVVLASLAQIFLQLSGINSSTYYAPSVFGILGFGPTISSILAASSQIVLIIGAVCCAWTVDRFGRLKLVLFSASAMAICFAFLAGLVAHPENHAGLKAAVFFLFMFFFVYVLGFLGIPFLYASEIAATHLRAPICGLSTAILWLFNFLVAEVAPVAFTNIGWRYFLVYCCLNAAFVPTILYCSPRQPDGHSKKSTTSSRALRPFSTRCLWPGSCRAALFLVFSIKQRRVLMLMDRLLTSTTLSPRLVRCRENTLRPAVKKMFFHVFQGPLFV